MADLNKEMEEAPVPTSETLEGTIKSVEMSTRGEEIPVDSFEDNEYPYDGWNEDDRVAVLEYTVEYMGETLEFDEIYSAPESYKPSHNVGLFEQQYGQLPKDGMTVQVAFDKDGNAQIVIADRN